MLISVWVHTGHEVDPCVVQDRLDAKVVGVLLAEVLGKKQKQFSTYYLVAVHVGYVLEFRFSWYTKILMCQTMLKVTSNEYKYLEENYLLIEYVI